MIAATPFFSDRGCHIRIYSEMKYLGRAGYDIHLVTYNLGYNPPEIDPSRIVRTLKIPFYTKLSPGFHFGKIPADFFMLFTAIREYFKFKPDVIHAHLYEALTAGIVIKTITFGKARLVFDCQGSLAEEMDRYTLNKNKFLRVLYPLFVLTEKFLLLFPEKIYCSSNNSLKFLRDNLGIKEERLMLLEDGIDEELFTAISEKEKSALRNELGIPKGNKVVVYSGSMERAKGVGDLLEVIPDILKERNDITFLFLGYGSLVGEYRVKMKEFIDNKNVIFYGRISYFELPKYLMLGDFGIDTKKNSSESSGKLYNYIAAKLPVICFKSEFTEKVLGKNGLFIKSFNEIPVIMKKKILIKSHINSDQLYQHLISKYKS